MNAFSINPYIRVAMPSFFPSGYMIKRRIIFDYELIFVESGILHLDYAQEQYTCLAGQLVLLRPGIPHSLTAGEGGLSQPHIHFDMEYSYDSERVPVSFKDSPMCSNEELKQVREDVFASYPQYPLLSVSDKDRFLDLFYRVVCPPVGTDYLTRKAKLTEIIAMIIKENYPDCLSATVEYPIEEQIKEYIDAGQCMNMSLSELSQSFAYDKFYLEKKFKQAFGISLMAYRNKKRMQLAKALLYTESVSTVAEKTGFKSIYAFSRAYKNAFGVCPSSVSKKTAVALESKRETPPKL